MNRKKPIYLLSTGLSAFWVLLPMVLVLCLSMYYNKYSEAKYKLYPLIAVSIAAIIFSFIYFLRFVEIRGNEIKSLGGFTAPDGWEITEHATLVLEMRPHARLGLTLCSFGGYNPDIKWLLPEEGEKKKQICVFRSEIHGTKATVIKILQYFEPTRVDFSAFFSSDNVTLDYEIISVNSGIIDGKRVIKIKLLKAQSNTQEADT